MSNSGNETTVAYPLDDRDPSIYWVVLPFAHLPILGGHNEAL